jgi:hypothetical protein
MDDNTWVSGMRAFGTAILSWLIVASFYLSAPAWANAQQVAQNAQPPTAAAASQKPVTDITGVWSGTLFSSHSDEGSFTITVVITRDVNAHLVGNSSLSSDCLRGAKLQAAVRGANITLAGSDEEGDNLTVSGTLDATGNVLEASYVLNASATGRCETDDGRGQLARR